MKNFRKIGLLTLKTFFQFLGILVYFMILIAPGLFIEDEFVLAVWFIFFLSLTFYGILLYKISNNKDKTFSFLQRIRQSVMEANKKFFIVLIIFLLFWILIISEQESVEVDNTKDIPAKTYVAPINTQTTQYTNSTYKTPLYINNYNNGHKYNSRSGYSGNYGYNYNVEGYSDTGGYFYGDVDTSGKYGEGYVYDDEGNEVYVETEWIDYGVMEATDEYGNTYEFEVE